MAKVAYIVSRFPHLPETFILREMSALDANGLQVELFPLLVQDQKVLHPESLSWLEKVHRFNFFSWKCLGTNIRTCFRQPGRYLATFFQVIWFNLPSLKFLIRALFIFPVAVDMAEDIRKLDICHIHAHYATHPALAAWIVARFTGIPFSMTVHAHDIFVNHTMLKQKLQKAAFIRAISEFNKNYLVGLYGQWVAEKIIVVHCGIHPEWYQGQIKKQSEIFQIIAVGSLQEYKGHEYLIKACSMLKAEAVPFQCRIVGGGELKEYLSDLVEHLGLGAEVCLVGPKTENEIVDLLTQAQCFVLPSVITRTGKMEGIPVVLMEALASKLPVVASDISGIPEIIQNHQSGLLIPPKDTLAMVQNIIWIRDHPHESEKMAETGCRKVWNEFNMDKIVYSLINLYLKFQYHKE